MTPLAVITPTTTLRRAIPSDWKYIDALRKKNGSSLGFIPQDAYLSVLEARRLANRDRFKTQAIYVTEDNGDLTGFVYASYASSCANIIQIVVQEDARRWHRALLLADKVEADARARYREGIKARVAWDLESNDFWKAIGYAPISLVTSTWLNQRESKSRRPLWIYAKHFGGLLDL